MVDFIKCLRCYNGAVNGKNTCEFHLNEHRSRRLNKIKKGVCAYCPKKAVIGKTICKECSNKRKEQRGIKKNNGVCTQTGCNSLAELNHTLCKPCSEKHLALRKALKEKVLIHYGYKCNCGCGCQVKNSNHLTIDHINNDGSEHRKKLGTQTRGGQAFYRWIVKNDFPKDLQILCWNCNCAKHYYGGCK